MADSSDDIARRAAARLAAEFGPDLPGQVEARLEGRGPPQRFSATLAVAIAGLLLNAAKFAWDIWRDGKKNGKPPAPEVMARRIRLELPVEGGLSEQQRDRLIAIVIEEVRKDP